MTVLEAVKKSGVSYAMAKGSIKKAQALLLPTENILWATTANISKGSVADADHMSLKNKTCVVIVVTEQRIFYVNNVWGIGSSVSIPISEIRSVEQLQHRFFSYLHIQALSQSFLVDGTKESIPPLERAIQSALAHYTAPAAASAPVPAASPNLNVEELKKLKELYDAGILTEEEFTAKKAQILGI